MRHYDGFSPRSGRIRGRKLVILIFTAVEQGRETGQKTVPAQFFYWCAGRGKGTQARAGESVGNSADLDWRSIARNVAQERNWPGGKKSWDWGAGPDSLWMRCRVALQAKDTANGYILDGFRGRWAGWMLDGRWPRRRRLRVEAAGDCRQHSCGLYQLLRRITGAGTVLSARPSTTSTESLRSGMAFAMLRCSAGPASR